MHTGGGAMSRDVTRCYLSRVEPNEWIRNSASIYIGVLCTFFSFWSPFPVDALYGETRRVEHSPVMSSRWIAGWFTPRLFQIIFLFAVLLWISSLRRPFENKHFSWNILYHEALFCSLSNEIIWILANVKSDPGSEISLWWVLCSRWTSPWCESITSGLLICRKANALAFLISIIWDPTNLVSSLNYYILHLTSDCWTEE